MKQKEIIAISAISILVFIDQVTKFFSQEFSGINLFILRTTYAENTGSIFGILKGAHYYLALISIAIILILIFSKIKYFGSQVLVLVYAGIIGNLIDRLFFGYVRDFIMFPWISWFPAFNLADSYLTIALIFIVLDFIWRRG